MLILLSAAIALGGGAASAWYALESSEGIGAVSVRGWVAYPEAGSPTADPYSKARVAREADLPLGRAEGIPFTATQDTGGARLRRECTYRIEGETPSARFWTLHVEGTRQPSPPDASARIAAMSSHSVMRESDGSMVVSASRHPVAGNWLVLAGSGPMTLVLTLYDTPVASVADVAETALPQVLRIGCDG